ncbi:hypothetical protein G3567_06825 [Psychroflexus sp. YR1-1]|uniref:Uncharacterized protein n=2 Tax=Psychroflexus aurantiacus TaxID=2709310 RepID=A0A6B3R7Z8_9FLAO|nr:hypothetical protein [Psychroflexus aurantiacus]
MFVTSYAQSGIENLLRSGIDDANKFANAYINPGSEAVIYSLANGWYNTAKVKSLGGFEISVIGGISEIGDDKTSFALNENDYSSLRFESGPGIQQVGTVLGQNSPDISMIITENDQNLGSITLPQGLASENVEYLPNLILQGSVGLLFSTELKLRFLPEVETQDVTAQFYGVGLQHEFTDWIPGLKVLPIAISGFVGYNSFESEYRFSSQSTFISGSNQSIVSDIESWHYALVASTKLPIINFYGSIGAVSGSADSALKGEYTISSGVSQIEGATIVDPLSTSSSVSGFRATVGTKLTLAFFRLNVDYSFQEFNSLNVGINFGI